MNFASLPIGDDAPHTVNVVVEIPKGTHNKYEYDETHHVLKLDRVLFSPFFYPTDYGFIPETRAEDGDHLDALIVTDNPTFPGCVVEARPIGILQMADDKGNDDKILAVPAADPRYNDIKTLEDLPAHLPKEIAHFFETYKELEKKDVSIRGWASRDEALKVIEAARKAETEKQAAV